MMEYESHFSAEVNAQCRKVSIKRVNLKFAGMLKAESPIHLRAKTAGLPEFRFDQG
jgi:hypothetical protein